jgi:uncharacterized protein
MHADLIRKRTELAALSRQYGVTGLEVFGSAARGNDFDPSHSGADFLFVFAPVSPDDLVAFADLLARPVDLVGCEAPQFHPPPAYPI